MLKPLGNAATRRPVGTSACACTWTTSREAQKRCASFLIVWFFDWGEAGNACANTGICLFVFKYCILWMYVNTRKFVAASRKSAETLPTPYHEANQPMWRFSAVNSKCVHNSMFQYIKNTWYIYIFVVVVLSKMYLQIKVNRKKQSRLGSRVVILCVAVVLNSHINNRGRFISEQGPGGVTSYPATPVPAILE